MLANVSPNATGRPQARLPPTAGSGRISTAVDQARNHALTGRQEHRAPRRAAQNGRSIIRVGDRQTAPHRGPTRVSRNASATRRARTVLVTRSITIRRRPQLCQWSVEAEVVSFRINHHDESGAHRRSGLLPTQSCRSDRDEAETFGLERCHSLVSTQSGSCTNIKVDAILGHLAFRHLLEEETGSVPVRVLVGRSRVALSSGTPTLSRKSCHAASGSASSGRSTPSGAGWT